MVETIIEIIQNKADSVLQDYNRFMQKPNEYKDEALLCKGQYRAYQDVIYYLKTHKEDYGCKNS